MITIGKIKKIAENDAARIESVLKVETNKREYDFNLFVEVETAWGGIL